VKANLKIKLKNHWTFKSQFCLKSVHSLSTFSTPQASKYFDVQKAFRHSLNGLQTSKSFGVPKVSFVWRSFKVFQRSRHFFDCFNLPILLHQFFFKILLVKVTICCRKHLHHHVHRNIQSGEISSWIISLLSYSAFKGR